MCGHLVSVVSAVIEIHQTVRVKFLPSAVKFHYNFNMRELVDVFQGLLQMSSEMYRRPVQAVRLFYHESARVFGDRLTTMDETKRFRKMLVDCTKKNFEEDSGEDALRMPCIFTIFIQEAMDGKPANVEARSQSELRRKVTEYLSGKCLNHPPLTHYHHPLPFTQPLILNETRIARILRQPRGNALLVGVGGSGKQRLASFICGIAVVTLSVTADYGLNDLREHLKSLYNKAGVRPGIPVVFMLTDSVIVDERFLVFMNHLLSSGYIPDLVHAGGVRRHFRDTLRNEACHAGVPEAQGRMQTKIPPWP